MSEVIQISNLVKQFKGSPAVNSASFVVRPGECFGLLGPNGAGKSTIINMLYGATVRSSGDLTVFGMDPDHNSRAIKKRIGVVTQDNALDESLTVFENMMIYAAFRGVPKELRQQQVDELLKFMNLEHKASAMIRFLSGGMKRRLVFVRALLGDPEIIILDEPTTGLDPAVRHLLWSKIQELKQRGKTIILTTHYMHEAEFLCDRLVIMSQGQVVGEGSPKELIKAHYPGYVSIFNKSDDLNRIKELATSLALEFLEDSSGIQVHASEFETLVGFKNQLGSATPMMRPTNLEDVFLKLTGKTLINEA